MHSVVHSDVHSMVHSSDFQQSHPKLLKWPPCSQRAQAQRFTKLPSPQLVLDEVGPRLKNFCGFMCLGFVLSFKFELCV